MPPNGRPPRQFANPNEGIRVWFCRGGFGALNTVPMQGASGDRNGGCLGMVDGLRAVTRNGKTRMSRR